MLYKKHDFINSLGCGILPHLIHAAGCGISQWNVRYF